MFHNKQPTVKQKKRMLWPTIDSLINFMVNKIFVCEPKSEVKKESKRKKRKKYALYMSRIPYNIHVLIEIHTWTKCFLCFFLFCAKLFFRLFLVLTTPRESTHLNSVILFVSGLQFRKHVIVSNWKCRLFDSLGPLDENDSFEKPFRNFYGINIFCKKTRKF